MPSKLGDRIYMNKIDNNNILIYDSTKIIKNTFNYVGLDWISCGDSLSLPIWTEMVADETGIVLSEAGNSGGRTDEILTYLEGLVSGDSTYLSKRDIISNVTSANDYAQNVSLETLTTNYIELVEFYKSQNQTAKLILIGVYDFINPTYNPTGDPNVANAAGLTFNQMRTLISNIAADYGAYYCDWSLAGIEYPNDIPDNIHPYSSSGSMKCMVEFIKTLNLIND